MVRVRVEVDERLTADKVPGFWCLINPSFSLVHELYDELSERLAADLDSNDEDEESESGTSLEDKGARLYIDGFILPLTESIAVLRDDDLVQVKSATVSGRRSARPSSAILTTTTTPTTTPRSRTKTKGLKRSLQHQSQGGPKATKLRRPNTGRSVHDGGKESRTPASTSDGSELEDKDENDGDDAAHPKSKSPHSDDSSSSSSSSSGSSGSDDEDSSSDDDDDDDASSSGSDDEDSSSDDDDDDDASSSGDSSSSSSSSSDDDDDDDDGSDDSDGSKGSRKQGAASSGGSSNSSSAAKSSSGDATPGTPGRRRRKRRRRRRGKRNKTGNGQQNAAAAQAAPAAPAAAAAAAATTELQGQQRAKPSRDLLVSSQGKHLVNKMQPRRTISAAAMAAQKAALATAATPSSAAATNHSPAIGQQKMGAKKKKKKKMQPATPVAIAAPPPQTLSSSVPKTGGAARSAPALAPAQRKKKTDYEQLPLLSGPPRVGDKVVFKRLVLSLSCTPEVSGWIEATVAVYDNASQDVTLELRAPGAADRPAGDGETTAYHKFENSDGTGEHGSQEQQQDGQHGGGGGFGGGGRIDMEGGETELCTSWGELMEVRLL